MRTKVNVSDTEMVEQEKNKQSTKLYVLDTEKVEQGIPKALIWNTQKLKANVDKNCTIKVLLQNSKR